MPYRKTKRAAQGRSPGQPRAAELPNLRRTVIVIDRDFGLRVTRLDLWKTRRVDSYLVHVDGKPWQRAAERLRVHDVHFHDLRHEGICRLFEMGLQIQEVALISGHTSWATLRRYTHLRPEDVLEKMK